MSMPEPTPVSDPHSSDQPEWMHDRDFMWRAATELLVALGVPPTLAARISKLRDAAETQLGFEQHRSEAGVASPEQDRTARNAAIDRFVQECRPLADSVIECLSTEGIAPELVGVNGSALRPVLNELLTIHAAGKWRELDDPYQDPELKREVMNIGRRHVLWVPARKATWGDARRITRVLGRMPKETLKRFTKVTHPLLLRLMVFMTLRNMRVSRTEEYTVMHAAD